ncbi:FAD-binding protein [Lentzea sp. NPDC051838]|uniref:FAD-binding protein n=1 Tax=Lentzea sp. NPDC051838 TaxID=3154849 RepID=UPI0034297D88
MSTEFDTVVLGAGLAGLSAAVTSATEGARTLVLERAPAIGGSAAISGGYVWAIENEKALRREDPGRYQRHGLVVVDGYHDAIMWLSGFAPPVTGEERALAGRGHKFDMPLQLALLCRACTAAGGRIVTDAVVDDVTRHGDGYQLDVTTPAGRQRITTRSLVLATGGRQADPDVRAGLVGGGFVPPLRSNPWSRGTGAALAAKLGASVNTDNTGFYGHLFAAGAEPLSPIEYIAFALYHSDSGVLLDASGRRFADETRGDHNNAMALAARGGRGLLLWSEKVQREAAETPFVPGSPQLDRWAYSRDRGGRVGVVDNALGFELDAEARARLGSGRVFTAEVVPAVTFTFGGIEADEAGTALDVAGQPIDGLFPVGADLSDVYHEGYGGGLCLAVVSGRRAGRMAALRTKEVHRA